MREPSLPSEVLRRLAAAMRFNRNMRAYSGEYKGFVKIGEEDRSNLQVNMDRTIHEWNVVIAKACYAERVLADDGDWYANQARKLPWEWAIEGGV